MNKDDINAAINQLVGMQTTLIVVADRDYIAMQQMGIDVSKLVPASTFLNENSL